MHLSIVTPEKTIYTGDVDELIVNTATGEISILPHHVNLFTKIEPGEVTLKTTDKNHFLAITGGFLELSNNKATILADYAVRAEEIELSKAIEAQKRAEETIRKAKEGISERDFATAQADLRRALLEIHVAKRRHKNIVQ